MNIWEGDCVDIRSSLCVSVSPSRASRGPLPSSVARQGSTMQHLAATAASWAGWWCWWCWWSFAAVHHGTTLFPSLYRPFKCLLFKLSRRCQTLSRLASAKFAFCGRAEQHPRIMMRPIVLGVHQQVFQPVVQSYWNIFGETSKVPWRCTLFNC